MFRYFLKRVGYMFLAILVISALTFGLLQLAPGNYLDTQRLLEKTMTDATVSAQMKEAWEEFYGLNQPAYQRYFHFLTNAVQGKFGPSYKYPTQNIEDIIARTLPVSARLALMAIGVSLVVGIPLGILAAIRQNKVLDRIVMFVSMLMFPDATSFMNSSISNVAVLLNLSANWSLVLLSLSFSFILCFSWSANLPLIYYPSSSLSSL